MQDKHLFEYAVIRVVPRVEREEFMNVGVILYCTSKKFLQTKCKLDEQRLQAFACELNIDEVKERLQAIDHVCKGADEGGPIGKLPIASRFRWLIAARSTIVQTSPVHPGLCIDPEETLARLYDQLVC